MLLRYASVLRHVKNKSLDDDLDASAAEAATSGGVAGVVRVPSTVDTPRSMEWLDRFPGVIGTFSGVMGWLLLGMLIQRRQEGASVAMAQP